MRIQVRHETRYTYEQPTARVLQNLRLTPRGHDSLFVFDWRIDVDRDCRLVQSIDPFGNVLHHFTVEGPLEAITVIAEGTVETADTSGTLSGTLERLPAPVFLRDTPLTALDAGLIGLADEAAAAGGETLARMHALMGAIHDQLDFDGDAPSSGATAAQTLKGGRGVCQDFAHVFLAAARHLGVPARYVSGYLLREDGENDQPAGHAWAEALIENLGWVGFDPANNLCPNDAYVRVAIGLDHLGAAPVRGAHYGGGGETLTVRVQVADVGRS